ncbi:DUF1963 domain-containing protein [Archangium sp.]|uniref:DUF1963 domain-containing protein n=1 Tax=Archangium sp. TaxID=1872627 RepID=UPI002D3B01CC|nr:DUF1963 domain-containing protein [Archangium sp.]HYO59863.1 DUF1963 domain-containing protein [Archangium sp.]
MRPSLELPAELRQLLRSRSPDLVVDVERFLADAPRRCTYIRSERVADAPLRRSVVSRLLGRGSAKPVLAPLDSKFGGVPYAEEADLVWESFSFLGQINFAQVEDPAPGLPRRGLFALDFAVPDFKSGTFRVRWYAEPSEERSRVGAVHRCVGSWETRMVFSPGWSLPGGKAWHAPLPADDEDLWERWNDWAPKGFLEDERNECHRLFGHRSAGLDEHSGFEPPPGRGSAIDEYELLWRITFDNSAGFAWGTNWVYVLIHEADLAENRLDRAVVTTANG